MHHVFNSALFSVAFTSGNEMYSNFRNYAPPLDEKGGIITEKVVPVFSESLFGACFGMVM